MNIRAVSGPQTSKNISNMKIGGSEEKIHNWFLTEIDEFRNRSEHGRKINLNNMDTVDVARNLTYSDQDQWSTGNIVSVCVNVFVEHLLNIPDLTAGNVAKVVFDWQLTSTATFLYVSWWNNLSKYESNGFTW